VYHATKWGIEGFVEAVAQEVAPFHIAFTIVEPGPTATGFGAALVSPPPLADYDATPAGEMRRAIANRTLAVKGDALKMARAMIASVGRAPAPQRLTLGSTAYTSIRAVLVERLAALDTQKDIALSTDADA
jgi:NAD(P)-dependent dehydrogenase (short-subunit alcohol dehydrogenase family)